MKKTLKYSLLGILAFFFIAGFALAAIIPSNNYSMTLMACGCAPSDEPYEISCNQVSGGGNFYFFTGILNVGEFCSGKEIISCPASEELTFSSENTRIDLECQIGISLANFGIPLSNTYNKSI